MNDAKLEHDLIVAALDGWIGRVNQDDREDDGGQRHAYLADRQTDAWEEFLMTGRPPALADYLQFEGEVDDEVRSILIDILRNGPRLINKGGRDSWRDYTAYVEIKMIALRGNSKTEACRRYAEKTNQELRTVEQQYERGSKIYGTDSDLFERVVPDREK